MSGLETVAIFHLDQINKHNLKIVIGLSFQRIESSRLLYFCTSISQQLRLKLHTRGLVKEVSPRREIHRIILIHSLVQVTVSTVFPPLSRDKFCIEMKKNSMFMLHLMKETNIIILMR